MKTIIAMGVGLYLAMPCLAQDLSCIGGQCSSTYTINDKTYTTVCTSSYSGDISCHTSDPDSHYNPGDGIRKFMEQGMTFEEASKAEEARYNEVMKEDAGELKARHELCDKGILKADRCDFSKPHPLGYRVPPPPQPVYQEATPQEQQEALKAGDASNCFVTTFPVGAEVFVDGVKVGTAPTKTFVLMKKAKPRKVTVKLAGYKAAEQSVTPDGKLAALGFTLVKETE